MGNHEISCRYCGKDTRYMWGDCRCAGALEAEKKFQERIEAEKKEKERRKTLTIDDRWEEGIPHYPEAEELIRLVDKLDETCYLDLKMGGDGDLGETLAYFLDVLIENDLVEIKIKGKL